MLQKYLHQLLDVDWGNQNLNCRCVGLCAREAACVILCEVREEQTFLILLLVSCDIDAGAVTLQCRRGNTEQCEWIAYTFAFMVLYFAPLFLNREENFHTESASFHK